MFLSLKIALSSLAAHKLRALLAVLGVLLGALVLTSVLHVSKAMVRKAEIETENLGPNLFIAVSGQLKFRRDSSASISDLARTFTLSDAQALLDGLAETRDGTPFVSKAMPIRAGRTKVMCRLVAGWPNMPSVRSFKMEYGRFHDWDEEEARAKVCVLGRTIATRLFGNPEEAVGRRVLFYRAELEVIGVMEPKGKDVSGTDQDEQVFVPLSTFMRRMSNQRWVSGTYINLTPGADPELVKAEAGNILRARHRLAPGKKEDFSFVTAKDVMRLQQQALDLVWTLGLLSSSISFTIGSLGIASIMILLVRARRLEIGVRRAVGARKRDIIRQFYLEAGIMSGAGGFLGVVLSLVIITLVYQFGGFPFLYDPALILGALAASVLFGLAAGSYPAWQASRIEVLEVLRGPE